MPKRYPIKRPLLETLEGYIERARTKADISDFSNGEIPEPTEEELKALYQETPVFEMSIGTLRFPKEPTTIKPYDKRRRQRDENR